MRKLFVLFVIALFLMSTVSAENFLELLKQKAKEKQSGEFDETDKETRTNVRNIAENKLLQIKEQLRIKNIELAESQENITELVRERKAKCIKEGIECKDARDKVKLGVKNYLNNFATMVISHLEKLKSKVESSENVDSEEAQQLLSDLDAEIKKIEEIKANIDKAETNEELKEAARNLKQEWKELRFRVLALAGKVANYKIGVILNRAENLENKLNRAIERMKESGKDTSDIQALIDEFHRLIANARENYKLAKEKFDEARNLKISDGDITEIKNLIEEGKKYLKEAKTNLKEANKQLKKIIESIKVKTDEVEVQEEE